MVHFFKSKILLKVISRILLIISAAFLVCAWLAFVFRENPEPFFYSFGISVFIGLITGFFSGRLKSEVQVYRKDAYLTVTLSWLIISLIGCLPYLFSGAIPGFVDAFFETVSGFTTTGSSILSDIEILPKSILFWRSLTHWIGGIGIIVLVIVIMPTMQIGGYHLFTLESSLQEKIQPKIKSVGYRLLLIYIGLTAAEIILLMLGKMNLFESTCHSFASVSTGGFSPKNSSIAGYSPYVQYVVMLFMLLAGINFSVYYLFVKRKFRRIKTNEELRFYLIMITVIGLLVTASLKFSMHKPIEESFREGFFQVISIVTCTGFASADYLRWPEVAWVIIFFSMFLGGCTGSTSGGIKMARHVVLFKNIRKIIRRQQSVHAVVPVTLNGNHLSDDSNSSILSYILVYLLLFVTGSILMVFIGSDILTAGSSVATCMAGIGPGMGTVGPVSNFSHIPDAGKMVLSFLMLLGRLEIFTVMILFSKSFWTK